MVMSRKLMKERAFDFHPLPRTRLSKALPESVILRIDGQLNDFHISLRLRVFNIGMGAIQYDGHGWIQSEKEVTFYLIPILDAFKARRPWKSL
jgi:hypothetical protein